MTSLQMIDPFFVGFENAFSRLNRTAKSSSFPPYNLIKKSENEYIIELAVAGYSKENISITLSSGTLEISGTSDRSDVEYLYKGISSKSFTRTFTVVDTIEVVDAAYSKDGVLTITLVNKVPDQPQLKKIKIN